MSLVKFSDYIDYLCLSSAMEELADDEVIVEWSEEEWYNLTVAERAEIEAEAIDGWAKWLICDEDDLGEKVKKYKAMNTQKRRKLMLNKDRQKFSNRVDKLKTNIHNKKGGVKVHRKKLIKKRVQRNKSKIAMADRVYGGKATSKYTKKKVPGKK